MEQLVWVTGLVVWMVDEEEQ